MKNICIITIICAYLRTPLSNLWNAVVFCFILTFLFHASFHGFTVLAGEHTVIVIQSQPIAAYNEAIKGFEEGCKRTNISIDGRDEILSTKFETISNCLIQIRNK